MKGKADVIQIVGVLNFENEQLEVTKWFTSDDIKSIEKEMHAILFRIFNHFIKQKFAHDLEKTEIMIGVSNVVPEKIKVPHLTNNVHYIFAQGRYLDQDRRSYFIPETVLVEGDITLEELNKL